MDSLADLLAWLNANEGAVMAVITAVYVLATIVLVLSAFRANALSRRNTDVLVRLEKERLRPFIATDTAVTDEGTFRVRVFNHGKTAALHLRFDVNPRIATYMRTCGSPGDAIREFPAACFDSGLKCLAPGASIEADLGEVQVLTEAIPDGLFQGIVYYQDSEGRDRDDPLVFDLRKHTGLWFRTLGNSRLSRAPTPPSSPNA